MVGERKGKERKGEEEMKEMEKEAGVAKVMK